VTQPLIFDFYLQVRWRRVIGRLAKFSLHKPDSNPFTFFQAHAGLQGTARPTHYTVLADQNGFSSDEIQRVRPFSCSQLHPPALTIAAWNARGPRQLTNSLSFVFGRATRSVSLVSAAYFADVCLEKCRSVPCAPRCSPG
jgi:eukaryotic translation initiation factor 2C